VEVRRGRHGLELRVDGTLASLLHDRATGPVWTALGLPLLALPPGRLRRVLVLGLGGGAVAHLVHRLAPRARLVGVEKDPEVAEAARAFFGLEPLPLRLVVADAHDYLRRARGSFDAVIEDVFVGRSRTIRKPGWLPEPGYRLAWRLVRPGGVLVANTIHEGPAVTRCLSRLGAPVVVGVRGYWNRVVAVRRGPLDAARLRRLAARSHAVAPSLPHLRLRSWPHPRPMA
jgi:spermidine synthase